MKIRLIIAAACAAIALAIPSFSQDVVTTPAPVSTNAPIPHYVRYSGTLPDGGSKSLQIRFSLYENQTGGQPVWSEVQTVTPVEGKYAVLLGAGTENGLPQSVFSAAQARWLGISIGAGQEQPRTILLATPYSLEASDAQTLAGHPASDFVLAGSNPAPKSETSKAKPNTGTDISQINVNSGLTITNGGTGPTVTMGIDATKVPFLASANTFTATQTISSGNIAIPATTSKTSGVITSGGNAIFQSFSKTSGANNLFLGAGSGNFTNSGKNNTGVGNVSLSQLTTAAGNMALGTDSLGKTTSGSYNTAIGAFAGYYNTTGGYNTYIGNSAGPASGNNALTNSTAIGASSVVGESNAVVLGGTGAYAVSVGIGTATPAYTLDVQGTGNFTGAVNYGASGIFSTFVEASETAGPGNAALLGFGSNGSIGTYGYSDTGEGVEGASNSGQGVRGGALAPVAGSEGVLGYTGTTFSNIYSAEAGVAYAGVWADTSSTGVSGTPVALFATSDSGYAAVAVNNSAAYPALYVVNSGGTGAAIATGAAGDGLDVEANAAGSGVVGTAGAPGDQNAGVEGVATSNSVVGGEYAIYSGIWGDTGVSSTTVAPAWAIGVLGTADDSHAGVFLNNSSDWSTLYVLNNGSGGLGDVSKPALFDTIMAVSKAGTCGVGSGSLSCTGQIKSLVSAGGGARTVETYAMQSPENWIEDFGSGNLVDGKAVITIDPAFAETVSGDGSYHVFITPNGDSKGLYVTSKSASGFEVRESGGGTSSLSFDYRIVAKRLGYEAQRLRDVTDTFTRETAAQQIAKNTAVKKATLRKPSPLEQALKSPHRMITPSPSPKKTTPPSAAAHKDTASLNPQH